MDTTENEKAHHQELKERDQQPAGDSSQVHNGEQDDSIYTEQEVEFADGEGTDLAETFGNKEPGEKEEEIDGNDPA